MATVAFEVFHFQLYEFSHFLLINYNSGQEWLLVCLVSQFRGDRISKNIMFQRQFICPLSTVARIAFKANRRLISQSGNIRYSGPLSASSSQQQQQQPSSGGDELITEEIYGRQRIYATDGNVRWTWNDGRQGSKITGYVGSYLNSMFLPINYPASVHKCYLKFHAWQTTETFVGAVVAVLCSQAMLESLGLTKAASAAGAVAIQWVLKDGIAEIGKLLFIKQFARSFDSHPKSWKAVGETLNTLGSGLQLCTVLAHPDYFLLLAATGNILKSMSYALWGATHVYFTRHFALSSNNISDLTAKADSQSAFALITGWLTGICLISTSHSPAFLFGCYFALAPLHAVATTGLLNNVKFELLNEPKAASIAREFVRNSRIPTTSEQLEGVGFLGEFTSKASRLKIPAVEIGCSIEETFYSLSNAKTVVETIRDENYIFGYKTNSDGSRWYGIVLHKDAHGLDMIKSLLNVIKFDHFLEQTHFQQKEKDIDDPIILELQTRSHHWTVENFPSFIAKLEAANWNTDSVSFDDPGYRANWLKLPKLDRVKITSSDVK